MYGAMMMDKDMDEEKSSQMDDMDAMKRVEVMEHHMGMIQMMRGHEAAA